MFQTSLFWLLLISISFAMPPIKAQESNLIASMDDLRFVSPKEKASARLVNGQVGKAVRFRFEADVQSAFFASNIRGRPEWDIAEGFSFWVRGVDCDGFCGFQFIYDDDYSVRYDVCFPVRNGEWSRFSVAWQDLIPVLPGLRSKPLGTPGGNPPSKLSAIMIGRWWYWGDYPPVCFDIDEVRLEPKVDRDTTDRVPSGPPLARVLAKLIAGKPVTMITMGDSLTDKRHRANREVCWIDLVKQSLKDTYQSEVSIVNPEIGGTQLRRT